MVIMGRLSNVGIPQKLIAERAGMDQPQVSRYLSGKMVPSIIMAQKLADAMEIELIELYRFILDKKENNNEKKEKR